MKKILFVIDSLGCGGAEKSLVTLLNTFDYSKANIDLLLFKRGGVMEEFLPPQVNLLPVPPFYQFLEKPWFWRFFSTQWRFVWHSLKLSIGTRLNTFRKHPRHPGQATYTQTKNALDALPETYDVAVAYAQGLPTYFVADKITAQRKLAWINCDYEKTLYDRTTDEPFYIKYDVMVAVSEHARQSAERAFPACREKITTIYDIVNPAWIREMAKHEAGFTDDFSGIRILTVGRLVPVKGHALAVEACRKLKNAGYPIRWHVIGDGMERTALLSLIRQEKLECEFLLLGAKSNPYPWMEKCDIYVQPSLQEGLGLTVIEAKILSRPIVCTNFETSREILIDEREGIIVEKTVEGIFQGVKTLLDAPARRQQLTQTLENAPPFDTTGEINKFYMIAQLCKG